MTETISSERRLALDLYTVMVRIRYFEEAAYKAYEAGLVSGTIHASIGQEAVAAGVMANLSRHDRVFSTHRGHGHALAKGMDPGRLMAELLGRSEGVCGGKGGSMHITDPSCGFMGSLAIVGSSVPVAVGLALSLKHKGSGGVCVSFFGEGANNQGVIYEAFNFASLWQVPVLFVCENNGYAITMASRDSSAGGSIVKRAQTFGLTAGSVDGQDALAVYNATQHLLQGVRRGVPALLECNTYRFMGHSRGDPPHGLYRTSQEVAEWRTRDPLDVLLQASGLDAVELEPIRTAAKAKIDAAVEYAKAGSVPSLDTVLNDIWG